jgi:hypothetical protein
MNIDTTMAILIVLIAQLIVQFCALAWIIGITTGIVSGIKQLRKD